MNSINITNNIRFRCVMGIKTFALLFPSFWLGKIYGDVVVEFQRIVMTFATTTTNIDWTVETTMLTIMLTILFIVLSVFVWLVCKSISEVYRLATSYYGAPHQF